MATARTPVRILIVEDNDPDVYLVEEALRSQGIVSRIQRCYDGEEALDVLSRMGPPDLPDIILIDLNLPKVNGLEILKHARGLKQLDRVPVLILTSSQSKTDRALSFELGADRYIAKPPTLPEFLSLVGSGIRELLERPESAPGARQRLSMCPHAQALHRLRHMRHRVGRPVDPARLTRLSAR
jgi:CheY-like chemotaxis protein